MSRTRAGREAQETHRNFLRNVGGFAEAFANNNFKHDALSTRAMIILRTSGGAKEVITFSQAYSELYGWEGKRTNNAFSNISDAGLYDMLADTFLQGASVFTSKAEYQLWSKYVSKPGICDLCGNQSSGGRLHDECVLEEEIFDELRYEEMEYAA